MKRRDLILGLVVLAALVSLFAYEQHIHPFDWRTFVQEFHQARWSKVVIGAACIYIAFAFRAARWAWLIRPSKRVPLFSLLGTQVMGFTAVALIGRIADPVRPYLVAKKTELPVSSQIAVYIVERLFDTASMALLFFSAIVLAPAGSLPHQTTFNRAAEGGLVLTVAGTVFLVAVRVAGDKLINFCVKPLSKISAHLAHNVAQKLHTFRSGLNTLRTRTDFFITLAISLSMWVLITYAYVEGASAFAPEGIPASQMWARCLALMAGGGVASALQLPVIGWFTQIAALQVMLRPLFGMTAETAMACAATLLAITFLSIAPVGLVWAQFEHINLRTVTVESERAEESFEEEADASPAS